MRVEGECVQCGACCKSSIQWMTCRIEDADAYMEYAAVHGKSLRQSATSKNGKYVIIQAEFDDRCPQLDENNRCKLHGPTKPRFCVGYPESSMDEDWNLDMGLVLPESCGFRFGKED